MELTRWSGYHPVRRKSKIDWSITMARSHRHSSRGPVSCSSTGVMRRNKIYIIKIVEPNIADRCICPAYILHTVRLAHAIIDHYMAIHRLTCDYVLRGGP